MYAGKILADDAQPANRFSIAAPFLRILIDYCADRGLPAEMLFRACGFDPAALDDIEGRFPCDDFLQLCQYAAKRFDDPCLGLHLGQNMKAQNLGPYGFGLLSCSTVRETFTRVARFSTLMIDAGYNSFEQRGDVCVRYWRSHLPKDAPGSRLLDELLMAGFITMARRIAEIAGYEEVNGLWVSFRQSPPRDLTPYQEIFRCPIYFGAEQDAIAFESAHLDRAMPGDPQVRAAIDALCERLLKTLNDPGEPVWLADCRRAIVGAFENGEPDLAHVAAALKLSPQALRQRLARRDSSFRGEVEALRRELALDYLKDPSLSLVDVAILLGFSEQSAFQRAFKRWTGETPGDFRKHIESV